MQSSKARFLSHLCGKNICDEREEVSHASCAKSVDLAQIIWLLGVELQKLFGYFFSKK